MWWTKDGIETNRKSRIQQIVTSLNRSCRLLFLCAHVFLTFYHQALHNNRLMSAESLFSYLEIVTCGQTISCCIITDLYSHAEQVDTFDDEQNY